MEVENKNDSVLIPELLKDAPEDIQNIYKEWSVRHNKLLDLENRYISIERPNNQGIIKLDLLNNITSIRKKIKDFSQENKDLVLKNVAIAQKERGKIIALKKQWMHYKPVTSVGTIDTLSTLIIELLGQFKTIEEIQQIVFQTHGVNVTEYKIKTTLIKNQDKIDKLKSAWEGEIDNFSVSRKRGRIERLVYLLQTQTDQYKKSDTFPVVRSQEIRAILEQIRKELEGDKIKIDINGNIDINASINMNMTLQQITSKVALNSFIVGLVAVKQGIDPLKLMHSLQNSYYKDYNGFTNGDMNKPMTYPSDLINNYDWNLIAEKHKDDDKIQEAVVVEEKPTQEVIDLKQKLKDMLAKKIEENEKNKIVLNKKK